MVGRSKTSLLKLANSNVRGVSYLLVLMYTKCNSPRSHGGLREEKRKMAGDDGFSIFPLSPFRVPLLIIFISLQNPMGTSSGIHDEIAVRGSEFVLLDG